MPSKGHGTFHWNELMTNDVAAATAFYRDVIGWSFDEMAMPEGSYWVAFIDGEPVAGIMAMVDGVPPGTPPHWTSYLAVDDVDARLAKAKSAGAEVLREPFDVPHVGRIAILKDGGGAALGWITPAAES